MFSNGWNPRNRSMPYANHDRAFSAGGEGVVHQSHEQSHMAIYESSTTATKVQQDTNQILSPTPPFPSSLNSSLGLQRSLLRGNPAAASLLQPHVIPLAPRNYSLRRQRPTSRSPPRPRPDQLDLLLPPPWPTSNSAAALIMKKQQQQLMALVGDQADQTSSTEVVRHHPAPNSLTVPYLDQLDRPIQMVVDLVETDQGEEAATNSPDLMLRL